MKRLIAILFLIPLLARAATVQFAWTNFDGSISTNDLVITMINPPINDGTFTIKGLPRRYATTNGFLSTTILTGNYSVVPYGIDIQPVLFAVPNDSQTYDYWLLRISGGNTYNYSPGVQQLIAGSGTSLSPSNGKGIVTVTSTGSGGIGAVAAGSGVTVSTNSNLYTVSLPFTPQIASSTLSNYSTVGTNYWYPTNNPQGFISSNNVANIQGYVTNVVTTNSSTGVTNIINGVIAGASIDALSDVTITTPANGQLLIYQNGWKNLADPSVTQVGIAAPVEFTVSGSPVTSSGTLTLTKANQSANLVYAGPTGGGASTPSFRALVAADIPPVSATTYASNILSGGNVIQSILASNAPANGYFLGSTNGFNFWIINAGALTNLQSGALVGLIPPSNEGTGSSTNQGSFLRGDRLWTNVLLGSFTVLNGNLTNSGNLASDNGAILSDGSGNLTALKHIGPHFGQGYGVTNVSATNLIDVLPDARISNNVARLNVNQLWTQPQEFQQLVTFDLGLNSSANNGIGGTMIVGDIATKIGSSNRFQINFQSLAQPILFQIQTNGQMWLGTNRQFLVDYTGAIQSQGTSNHFNGQIVDDGRITAAQVFSDDIRGNIVYDKVHNLEIADFEARLLFDGNTTASLDFTNRQLLNSLNFAAVDWQKLQMQDSNGTKSEDWGVRELYDHTGTLQLSWFGGPITGSGVNLTALNASQLTSGTMPAARLPVLGTGYPDALTNNEARTPVRILATSNWFGGTLHGAQISADAFTNGAATVSTIPIFDANKKEISLANGGANTVIHGTTPPAYSAVVEADQSLSDVTTANSSTSAHGYLKKLDNTATHYMDGTGNWSTPASSGGTDSTAWHTNGNAGVTAASGGFLGTTDANPLELKANANIVAWFAPNASPNTHGPDIVFGGGSSTITNQITLGAGTSGGNIIAGGEQNLIQGSGSSIDAGIFAGNTLTLQTNCGYTVMLGGNGSIIRSNSSYSFIIGGGGNDLGVGPSVATLNSGILGGLNNTNSGNYSIVLGGARNAVSAQSALAAGNQAKATHQGSFVWADSQASNFTDAGQDTFNIRATNGIRAVSALYMTNVATAGILPDVFVTNTAGANQWMKLQSGNLSVGGTISGSFSSIPQSSMLSQYSTNLFGHFADAGNSGTSDTALYNDSVPANTLSANGQKIRAEYALNTVLHATATRQIKVFFGGTSIFDTGALVYSANGSVAITAWLIRDSSTSIRYRCTGVAYGTAGTISTNFTSVGKLTGLTLSSANTLELHGQAAATGAASNDIVATMGDVEFKP